MKNTRNLLPGVTKLKGTDTYQIRHKINGKRPAQYTQDRAEANAYKAYLNAADCTGPVLLIDEWRLRLKDGEVPGSSSDRPTGLRALPIKQAMTELAKEAGVSQHVVNVFIEFAEARPETVGVMDDASNKIIRQYPKWLAERGYAKGSAGHLISGARMIWMLGVEDGYTSAPRFTTKIKPLKPVGGVSKRRPMKETEEERAWTIHEIVSLARLLPVVYLIAFWIACLAGLRRSEIFGLQIQDWDPGARLLAVRRQRKASPAKGTTDTKEISSVRWVPVTQLLADALNSYIGGNFGECPADPTQARAWKEQYLVVSNRRLRRLEGRPGPMDSASFHKALSRAYEQLGMTPQLLGFYFKQVHSLRKWFGTQIDEGGFSGKTVSMIMGHLCSATEHLYKGGSKVTLKHYLLVSDGDIDRVRDYLDDQVTARLAEAGVTDLLSLGRDNRDLLTQKEAAHVLGIQEGEVLTLVQNGIVGGAMNDDFTGPLADRALLVDAQDVYDLAADLRRAGHDTYSAAEASAVLAIGRRQLLQLAEEGKIREVTTNSTKRLARLGAGGGFLPGGGRRFLKSNVDRLAAETAEAIERVRTWLTIGQVAPMLHCSADVVRRKLEGELRPWRDPRIQCQDRYYDPALVVEVRRRYATLTTQEAADRLGVTPSVVEALVRTGELATAPALGRNEAGRRFSEQGLDDYRSRLGTVTVRLADGTVVTGTVMPDAA